MPEPDAAPFVERFELALLTVATPAGAIAVPVVDGWIEVQMALLHVPGTAERRDFYAALAGLRALLARHSPEIRWYFLHKAPGLKLRVRTGMLRPTLIADIIGTIDGWRLPWLRPSGMGSVFDQAELMPQMFRDDATRLLAYAAEELVAVGSADRRCGEQDWAAFLIGLLGAHDLDAWIAHEALSRLRRLRAFPFAQADAPAEPLLDPSGLLARPLAPCAPGFAASVSLLQTINLMLNMWGVDAGAQRRILDRACAITRPQLMEPAHG